MLPRHKNFSSPSNWNPSKKSSQKTSPKPIGHFPEWIDIAAAIASITDHTTHPTIVETLKHSATIPIHPIFHDWQWADMEATTYVRMLPALALAGHLLTCAAASNFFYALLEGPRTETVDHLGYARKVFSTWKGRDVERPLPFCAQGEANYLLQQMLPQMITLHLENLGGSCAVACPAFDRPMFTVWRWEFYPHCKIKIDRTSLEQVRFTHPAPPIPYVPCKASHVSPPPPPPTVGQELVFKEWFEFAVSLVHEIAHAASMALEGPGKEMFFQDDQYIEMGFAFESCIFGGIPMFDSGSGENCLILLHEMPSALLSSVYDEGKNPWPMRSEPRACLKSKLLGSMFVNHVQDMIFGRNAPDGASPAKVEAKEARVRAVNEWMINWYREQQESADTAQRDQPNKSTHRLPDEDPCDDSLEDDETFAWATLFVRERSDLMWKTGLSRPGSKGR